MNLIVAESVFMFLTFTVIIVMKQSIYPGPFD